MIVHFEGERWKRDLKKSKALKFRDFKSVREIVRQRERETETETVRNRKNRFRDRRKPEKERDRQRQARAGRADRD